MIFDDAPPGRFEPASWLARARAQSLRLADARARRPRSWRPATALADRSALLADRLPARGRIEWAMAGGLALLLLASGAWALVARVKKPAPMPPAPPSRPAALRPPAPALALPPSPPAPPAKSTRRKAKKSPPPRASTSQPASFEEGDGELILVAPHEPPTPLFSPEEWKQKGR